MKTLKTLALAALALMGFSGAANAAEVFLATDDFRRYFILGNFNGYVRCYSFLLYGKQANVSTQWRTSVTRSWFNNWYSFHSLHVHESSLG